MSALITLLTTLNSLSPLAVIALLGLIIWTMVRNHKELKDNDLHSLPEVVETLRRMETAQAAGFATIIAKLNGK